MIEQEVIIQIHNVKIKVSTNYVKYYNYLCLHFNKVVLPLQPANYEIEVKADWKMDFWGKHPPKLNIRDDMAKISANSFMAENCISTVRKIGKKKKVWLNYSLENRKLYLEASLHYKIIKDKIRYDIIRQPQEAYFFELTYPLVYYPLFWYLEYFKDTHPLHASAVRIADKCIIICGLEGMGKTTLSLSLAKEPGGHLFSDNLIFYDKDNIFPCYEPIRIHKSDDKSLWEGRFKKINQFKTLKDFYEPVSFNSEAKDRPNIFIIPIFSQGFSVQQIPTNKFINKILNFNQLTAELGNYNEYAALLSLLNLDFNLSDSRYKTLNNILNSVQCYEIYMPKNDGLKKNFERIMEFIKQCS